jgi:hypothetical protein
MEDSTCCAKCRLVKGNNLLLSGCEHSVCGDCFKDFCPICKTEGRSRPDVEKNQITSLLLKVASPDATSQNCQECENRSAAMYCPVCGVFFCSEDDAKIHSKSLKFHERVPIAQVESKQKDKCSKHPYFYEYFCTVCNVAACAGLQFIRN